MHTEEEAKTKWCPFARGLTEIGSEDGAELIAGVTRSADGGPHIECRCIASECMAWRWARTHVKNSECPDGDLIPSTRTYGFCGLSGTPFAGYEE